MMSDCDDIVAVYTFFLIFITAVRKVINSINSPLNLDSCIFVLGLFLAQRIIYIFQSVIMNNKFVSTVVHSLYINYNIWQMEGCGNSSFDLSTF